jgi:hypothetical protein
MLQRLFTLHRFNIHFVIPPLPTHTSSVSCFNKCVQLAKQKLEITFGTALLILLMFKSLLNLGTSVFYKSLNFTYFLPSPSPSFHYLYTSDSH